MPTIITKTIGPVGRDYATFTAAEAAVSTIPTTDDMVLNDEAIVFEVDAGTYSGSVTFDSSSPGPGLTMDATRNITYRPAAGSEHGGVPGAGVHIDGAIRLIDNFQQVLGISVRSTAGYTVELIGDGLLVDGCIIESTSATSFHMALNATFGGVTAPNTAQNCVLIAPPTARCTDVRGSASGGTVRLINNTFLGALNGVYVRDNAGETLALELVNNLTSTVNAYTVSGSAGGITLTGSNNVGGSSGPFPVAQQAGSQTWTFTTDTQAASTGNRVIYDATNGAMVDAPGNDAWKILTDLSVAPTTDIEGVTREATGYNPGAFERTAAEVGTPIGGGVDYLRDLNIRDRFLRGAAIREPFIRNLRD